MMTRRVLCTLLLEKDILIERFCFLSVVSLVVVGCCSSKESECGTVQEHDLRRYLRRDCSKKPNRERREKANGLKWLCAHIISIFMVQLISAIKAQYDIYIKQQWHEIDQLVHLCTRHHSRHIFSCPTKLQTMLGRKRLMVFDKQFRFCIQKATCIFLKVNSLTIYNLQGVLVRELSVCTCEYICKSIVDYISDNMHWLGGLTRVTQYTIAMLFRRIYKWIFRSMNEWVIIKAAMSNDINNKLK